MIQRSQSSDVNSLVAKLEMVLCEELSAGTASVKKLANGIVHIVIQGELLFFAGDDARLSPAGKALLSKFAPLLRALETGQKVHVRCYDSRGAGLKGRQAFVECWKSTGWCSSHVVRYFLWEHQLYFLDFRAEGHSRAEPLVPHDALLAKLNRRIEICIEPAGGI
ncbi:hypothetical protein F3F93_04150 [Mariprofundus sp. KV]|nr:hypothetical protein [Mariprofundus sp. KV]